MNMKKCIIFLAMLILTVLALVACKQEIREDPQVSTQDGTVDMNKEVLETTATVEVDNESLWVLVDGNDALASLAEKMIEQFREIQPNIQVKIQRLSIDNEELRNIQMQQLRTQIMAGKGPDVYLVPSTLYAGENLIQDPELAMRNGLFEDISEYYDADEDLKKEDLVTAVMDAGVVDDARYILPLRYDMPIAYVDVAQFEVQGGSLDMFEGGITNLLDQLLASGNPELSVCGSVSWTAMRSFSLNFYPQLVDYDNQELLLTSEDMMPFLQSVQNIRAAQTIAKKDGIYISQPPVLNLYIQDGIYWNQAVSMYIGRMQDIPLNATFSKAYDVEIVMVPVAAADGDLVADVTYYGAVGYGCDNVELAYELLRIFLTEDAQWEHNKDTVHNGMANYCGWPVRAKYDEDTLDKQVEYYVLTHAGDSTKQAELKDVAVAQDDFLVLDAQIDRTQFLSKYEIDFHRNIIEQLNAPNTGEIQTVDIESLLEEFLDELKWHLAEG